MGSEQQGARELCDCKEGGEMYDRFLIVEWKSGPLTKGMLY